MATKTKTPTAAISLTEAEMSDVIQMLVRRHKELGSAFNCARPSYSVLQKLVNAEDRLKTARKALKAELQAE